MTRAFRNSRLNHARSQQLLLEHAYTARQVAAALIAVGVGLSTMSFGLAFMGMKTLVTSLSGEIAPANL